MTLGSHLSVNNKDMTSSANKIVKHNNGNIKIFNDLIDDLSIFFPAIKSFCKPENTGKKTEATVALIVEAINVGNCLAKL